MPTTNTFLLAEGTLDAHIQRVLARKAEVVDGVLGTDEPNDPDDTDSTESAAVHVVDEQDLDDLAGPSEIVQTLVEAAITRHRKQKGKGPGRRATRSGSPRRAA